MLVAEKVDDQLLLSVDIFDANRLECRLSTESNYAKHIIDENFAYWEKGHKN